MFANWQSDKFTTDRRAKHTKVPFSCKFVWGFFSGFFLPGVKLPPIFPLNAHPVGAPLPIGAVRKSDEFHRQRYVYSQPSPHWFLVKHSYFLLNTFIGWQYLLAHLFACLYFFILTLHFLCLSWLKTIYLRSLRDDAVWVSRLFIQTLITTSVNFYATNHIGFSLLYCVSPYSQ